MNNAFKTRNHLGGKNMVTMDNFMKMKEIISEKRIKKQNSQNSIPLASALSGMHGASNVAGGPLNDT